jgi:SAM-dependent methyltransferase
MGAIRRIRRAKYLRFGFCNLCGRRTVFCGVGAFTLSNKQERNDLGCARCGAKARTRAIAAEILRLPFAEGESLRRLGASRSARSLTIYNAAARGGVHDRLSGLPNYVCSEFFPDVARGTEHGGVRCEDLESLTFGEGTIDLMISEDVMEHVRHPRIALEESFRVLRSGGFSLFSPGRPAGPAAGHLT